MKKKLLSAVCAVVLSISLTACSSGGEFLSKLAGNTNKWVDSNLIGSVPEDTEIRLQDDFAAAVNQEWKNSLGEEKKLLFQDVSDNVLNNKKRIVTDESIEGDTAKNLKNYYELASNWDERKADGISPLKPYIDDIESIKTIDEMYDFMADPKRNPLFISPISITIDSSFHLEEYEDDNIIYIKTPEMSLTENGSNDNYFKLDSKESFEKYLKVYEKANYLLVQLGYTESEASNTAKKCIGWEQKVAKFGESSFLDDLSSFVFTYDEIASKTGNFPIQKILEGWGFEKGSRFIMHTDYAKKLDSLCSERNLEGIKSFLIMSYALNASKYLDRDTYDKMNEIDKPKAKKEEPIDEDPQQLEEELIFDKYIGSTPMVGAMNKLYVEYYFDDSTVDELTNITHDVIDGFKDIFSEESWLSEEGKKACMEKLDAIHIHIAAQNFDSVDYGKIDIKSHAEGGSFLEAYFESKRLEMDHIAWLSQVDYDRSYWDPMNSMLSTTITNAMYNPGTNAIYIFAGILADPVYRKDMSYEEKLAKLFTIVGHEITHGFDKSGSQYDKYGYRNPILTDKDLLEFNDRNDNVASYYTTLSPFVGAGLIVGTNVSGEATADMGGIKVTLHLAKKQKDFDYDKYFRSYAELWRENVTVEKEQKTIKSDVHPLAFYRVNVGLQQFDEFYETYDIKPGDGMYIAPEKRIKVW